MIEALIAGLSLGFVGSLHCVGMCGPLVMSVPLGGETLKPSWWRVVIYHLSRAWGYALMGGLVGLFGKGLQQNLPPNLHMNLAIFSGMMLLLLYLLLPRLHLEAPGRWWLAIQRRVSGHDIPGGPWILGLLNAFLPCGLVYVALAMALATSSPLESMGLMLAFGLGTSPALILVVGLGRVIRLGPGWGRRIKVASVYVCSGLLILRGMGLGIPYLSPVQDALQLEKSSTENSSCECHRKD